jgi:hypothetical protein
MATEIVLIKLKPDVNINDAGPDKAVWEESLQTVVSQPGAQRAYWGYVSLLPVPF